MQRLHTHVFVRVILAAVAVVIEHRLERRESAVVHIRRGDLDVAQRRRLEAPDVLRLERDVTDAAIGARGVLVESGVDRLGHHEVRVLIGKMTERAVAQEQRLAAILLEREVGEVVV